MTNYGIKTDTFDSRQEHVLFYVDGRALSASAQSFSYPALAGKKVAAFLTSPYLTGDLQGWAVQSCRVSYPGGIPTVSVFYDNALAGLEKCDGYLAVFDTGANQ